MNKFNADLIDDLARQKVVLFLGSGVSASAITSSGTRISGWDFFLRKAAEDLDAHVNSQVLELLDEKDYLLACEIIQSNLSDRWSEKISDEFGQKAVPSCLHKAIVALEQRLIITTNFDKLLESAWEAVDKNATHYPSLIDGVSEEMFKALKDHSRTYIIKMHGTVDRPRSMIFSRSEYIRSAFGNLSYTAFLESLLLNYTFLFIGFSMSDPAITSLMELYTLRFPNVRPHYIFSPAPIPENIREINKRLRKLVHILYDPSNHHSELSDQVLELGKLASERRREILSSAF